jgi:hypothetical protein
MPKRTQRAFSASERGSHRCRRHGEAPETRRQIGNSLGGGLAQQAGSMSVRIQRVYAFDPSHVTVGQGTDAAGREVMTACRERSGRLVKADLNIGIRRGRIDRDS